MRKFKTTKICPRCGEKCDLAEPKCTDCGLVFSRLEFGSNKLAKKNIIAKQKDQVVYVKQFPKDLKRWKVGLLCGFLGLWGIHNLYVGKFFKGIFMLIAGILVTGAVTITALMFNQTYTTIASIFGGFLGIFWILDFFNILFCQFKVPISIDLMGGVK
ncbi:MAG: hypothetical protein IJA69_02875 [Clostridia bacterium]|nr:hypothetical protein [Clostridia bacterium]